MTRPRLRNRQADRLFEFADYNFQENIIQPLDILTETLKHKLQSFEVQELTGHGFLDTGVNALKYHPMYQPKQPSTLYDLKYDPMYQPKKYY